MMVARRRRSGLLAGQDEPLIAIPVERDGREVVRYFTDDAAADEAAGDNGVQDALALAGVWSDLDWDEVADELDRIRHESKPTPPLDLDL
jgi:hypothetical protein